MNVRPTLDQDKMAERLARSKQTAGAFCESSLLRLKRTATEGLSQRTVA
jgi:hypothetical protein